MSAIPSYSRQTRLALLSAGFRPFFLLSALWAALAIPIWLAFFLGQSPVPTSLSPVIWHVHEMIFGFGAATVAGFLLTAIPNWTGRKPLQGGRLAILVLLWIAGRVAMLFSARIGAGSAAILDLAFPLMFLAVVAREILSGRNWRNLPMLGALALLLFGNLLVHLDALGVARAAEAGNRLGVATLLMLIAFVGGRIVPSFTQNWLAKQRPETPAPAPFDSIDRAVLALVALALIAWVLVPDSTLAPWAELAGGLAIVVRLARWRGGATLREPLLWVLHLGYGWLGLGLLLLGFNGFEPLLPQTTALHALTAGAIGTMTLAVMTRASLGHTGRPLVAGPGTTTIYVLITLAAILRLLAPLGGGEYVPMLLLAGAAWSGAFGLFVLLYARPLAQPRVKDEAPQPT
ncbi:MAG TPA: NnrS family protein [Stellaceae bacterium]|nr:NnrS family protein [Stellaceae bacterium]